MIDIHPHVISHDHERYPLQPLGGKQSVWSQERPVDTDQLLAAMDDAGVEHAALVQAATAYGNDNSYVADSVQAHPDRFTGVCTVDLLARDAVQRLEYWLDERDLSSVRLFTSGSTMVHQSDWLTSPEAEPAWAWLQDRRIPISVQMRPAGIPMVRSVLESFPELRIVVDNAARVETVGGPPYPQAAPLFELADVGEVYVKVTVNTLRRAAKEAGGAESFMRALCDRFGSGRVAWGSDFPAMDGSLPELVRFSEGCMTSLTEDERADVFGDTALALYPKLGADEPAR
jgi:L-fuconolactonase